MTVGENIKRIRKEKGLTQKKLGELCGINEVQIRQYESGKANPKIETIDKIASALEVPIIKIKEDITWEEHKNTTEMKRLYREANAIDGVIAILAGIYGKAECKEILGEYRTACYYVVGEGEKQFVLHEDHIDTLYNAIKAFTPFLVDNMKDCRSEDEIIQQWQIDLDSPPPYDFK